MTGKEANEILQQLFRIKEHLINEYDRSAFFLLGILCATLTQIIELDNNPTVKEKE